MKCAHKIFSLSVLVSIAFSSIALAQSAEPSAASSSYQGESSSPRDALSQNSLSPSEGDAEDLAADSYIRGEVGTGTVEFNLGFYFADDDNAGNPFYDESLTVVEPVVLFSYQWTGSTNIYASLNYDYVSSASIERLDTYEVTAATSSSYIAQSGASGDNYFGIEGGLSHKLNEEMTVGAFGSYGVEYDYQSIGFGGSFDLKLAEQNARLSTKVQAFVDQVDVILFDGNEEGRHDRNSIATQISFYQTLSPISHMELGLNLGLQEGYLSTPYNGVVLEDSLLAPNPYLENRARGVEIREYLPSRRNRGAIYGRYRRLINSSWALEMGGRFYQDSWGVESFSLEPKSFHWLVPERLRLSFRYRYYSQQEANDFAKHFIAETRHRTQDSDLGEFDSHTVGSEIRWRYHPQKRVSLSADYVFRSDSLDQLLVSLTWAFDF